MGLEDTLEKEMAAHSSIPALEISWTRGDSLPYLNRKPAPKKNWGLHLNLCYVHSIYSFLAVLGLGCCVGALSRCGEQGLLSNYVHRLLILMASLVVEPRL